MEVKAIIRRVANYLHMQAHHGFCFAIFLYQAETILSEGRQHTRPQKRIRNFFGVRNSRVGFQQLNFFLLCPGHRTRYQFVR